MSSYEIVIDLSGASLRVGFESPGELEQKLDAVDLLRVAAAVDAALDRLPHPPSREAGGPPMARRP